MQDSIPVKTFSTRVNWPRTQDVSLILTTNFTYLGERFPTTGLLALKWLKLVVHALMLREGAKLDESLLADVTKEGD